MGVTDAHDTQLRQVGQGSALHRNNGDMVQKGGGPRAQKHFHLTAATTANTHVRTHTHAQAYARSRNPKGPACATERAALEKHHRQHVIRHPSLSHSVKLTFPLSHRHPGPRCNSRWTAQASFLASPTGDRAPSATTPPSRRPRWRRCSSPEGPKKHHATRTHKRGQAAAIKRPTACRRRGSRLTKARGGGWQDRENVIIVLRRSPDVNNGVCFCVYCCTRGKKQRKRTSTPIPRPPPPAPHLVSRHPALRHFLENSKRFLGVRAPPAGRDRRVVDRRASGQLSVGQRPSPLLPAVSAATIHSAGGALEAAEQGQCALPLVRPRAGYDGGPVRVLVGLPPPQYTHETRRRHDTTAPGTKRPTNAGGVEVDALPTSSAAARQPHCPSAGGAPARRRAKMGGARQRPSSQPGTASDCSLHPPSSDSPTHSVRIFVLPFLHTRGETFLKPTLGRPIKRRKYNNQDPERSVEARESVHAP